MPATKQSNTLKCDNQIHVDGQTERLTDDQNDKQTTKRYQPDSTQKEENEKKFHAKYKEHVFFAC